MMERDPNAGLKMRGALLRLDVRAPQGFTARQFADEAGVPEETARSFLKDRRFTTTLDPIAPTEPADSGQRGSGRPANRFVVSDAGRSLLLDYAATARRLLLAEQAEPDPFAGLEVLEDSLAQLEKGGASPGKKADRLMEVRLELTSARADLRALRISQPDVAKVFEPRLLAARKRLEAIENPRPIVRHEPSPLQVFVDRFGEWWDGLVPKAVQPVIMLLDGIAGPDPVTANIGAAYASQGVPVARVDVAGLSDERRKVVRWWIDRLRDATPLSACDVFLSVDGETDIGKAVAQEFRELGLPAQQQTPASPDADAIGMFDFDRIRIDHLQRRYAPATSDSFAHRWRSALSAVAGAKAARERTALIRLAASPSRTIRFQERRRDGRSSA